MAAAQELKYFADNQRCLGALNEGQVVEYEIESNRGKESAINLKVK